MIPSGALIIYRGKPGIVTYVGDRIEISLTDGSTVKVREKDILLLHPGPSSFPVEPNAEGDFETARQMLQGKNNEIKTVCELVFGDFTPGTALAVWNNAVEGLLFRIENEQILALTDDEKNKEIKKRIKKADENSERELFIERAKKGLFEATDNRFLGEIESVALGKKLKSKIASEMGLSESSVDAHAFLLRAGYWKKEFNPWPVRSGLPLKAPEITIENDNDENRLDLTGFTSLAIDNSWSTDPDDAIAFDNGKVIVSIADPASVVLPDSEADFEASNRWGTLYLPEYSVPMLPEETLKHFSLGLSEISRAISFIIEIDSSGIIENVSLVPSFIRVKRFSYENAMELIEGALAELNNIAFIREKLRIKSGAINIDIPEITIRVQNKIPIIISEPRMRTHDLVREMMILCGEASARWAFDNNLPFPYYGQEAPLSMEKIPPGLAGEFAKLKLMKAGGNSRRPVSHQGLGVSFYAQVTSPLRRYADLLAHQQLRAILSGKSPSDTDTLFEKIGKAQAAFSLNRQAEKASELHWTLIWLDSRPGWEGDGIVTSVYNGFTTVFIPELGYEVRLKHPNAQINANVRLKCSGVDIPRQNSRWAVLL